MMKYAITILLLLTLLLTSCGQAESGKNADVAPPASGQILSGSGQAGSAPEGIEPETSSPAVPEANTPVTASPETLRSASVTSSGAQTGAVDRGALPAMTNADGVRLWVGMSRAEYEVFYGQAFEAEMLPGIMLENGWMTNYPDGKIGALSLGDRIVLLAPGDGWTLDNGITTGISVRQIRELLGGEDSVKLADPAGQDSVNRYFYHDADGGTMELSCLADGDADEENDILSIIRVYSAAFDEASNDVLGIVYLDRSGEGDAVIESAFLSAYVDQNLNFEGAVKLYFIEAATGDEYELFSTEGGSGGRSHKGPYELQRKNAEGSFRIETEDGKWRIRTTERAYTPPVAVSGEGTAPSVPAGFPESPTNAAVRDVLPVMTNAEGVRIHVGMSRGEFETAVGRTVENGWLTSFRSQNLAALSLDDRIVWLTPGTGWTLSNGMAEGMPIERAMEILGEEDLMIPFDPENRYSFHRIFYQYEDGGTLEITHLKRGDDNNEAGTAFIIYIYSAEYDETSDALLGTVYLDESGEGNAELIQFLDPYIEISIDCETAIKLYYVEDVTGDEYELSVEEGGVGQRRVIVPDVLQQKYAGNNPVSGRFRIETDGAWRIRVIMPKPSQGEIANPIGE